MPRILNWDLLRNPLNWAIVYLMVATAALVFFMIDGHATGN